MPSFLSRLFKPLSEEDLPAVLITEVRHVFPGARFDRIEESRSGKRWRKEFEIRITSGGQEVDLETEFDREHESVYELEINFVLGSDERKIVDDEPIDLEAVPTEVLVLADGTVSRMVDGFRPESCERGENRGTVAYRIHGTAGPWKVKIKILETGQVLEMQKKRVDRGAE